MKIKKNLMRVNTWAYKVILILTIFTMTSLAHLNSGYAHPFNGKWIGTGITYDTQKMKVKCNSMIYTIESQNEFINIKSQIICGHQEALSLEGQLTLKGEDLYYKNQHVGTLKENHFDLKIKDHHQSIEVSGSVSADQELNLIEMHTYQPFPDYFYTVEATLHLETQSVVK